MNPWLILVVAGLFEVGFTTCMKLSEGFTQIKYTLGFIFFSILSLFLLNKAILQIPLGTAYAVWTGIGTVGSTVVGMWIYGEPKEAKRLLFIAIILCSAVGLKLIG